MSPVVDPHALAVAVLYLLWGWGRLEFPSTTRAHPSWLVCVQRAAGTRSRGYDTYFPMWVRWDLWEKVVVPVYSDDTIQPTVPEIQYEVRFLGVEPEIARIEQLLRAKMIEQGDLPPVSP